MYEEEKAADFESEGLAALVLFALEAHSLVSRVGDSTKDVEAPRLSFISFDLQVGVSNLFL